MQKKFKPNFFIIKNFNVFWVLIISMQNISSPIYHTKLKLEWSFKQTIGFTKNHNFSKDMFHIKRIKNNILTTQF